MDFDFRLIFFRRFYHWLKFPKKTKTFESLQWRKSLSRSVRGPSPDPSQVDHWHYRENSRPPKVSLTPRTYVPKTWRFPAAACISIQSVTIEWTTMVFEWPVNQFHSTFRWNQSAHRNSEPILRTKVVIVLVFSSPEASAKVTAIQIYAQDILIAKRKK